jgi:hypothetical protein
VNPAEGHASRGPHVAVLTAMPAHPSIIASAPPFHQQSSRVCACAAARAVSSLRVGIGARRAPGPAEPRKARRGRRCRSQPITSHRSAPAVPQVLFAPCSRQRRTGQAAGAGGATRGPRPDRGSARARRGRLLVLPYKRIKLK